MSDEIKNENEFNEFEDPLELEFGEDENKDDTITKTCIVYKIFCKIEDSIPIYIGSTIQKLRQRWDTHKKSFNDIKKCKKRMRIVAIYPYFEKYDGVDNFQIESLEQVKITGVRKEILKQTRMLEQKWMDKFKSEGIEICNRNSAYTTEEQKKQQRNEYQKINSVQIQSWRKMQTECEVCGGTYINSHKARHLKSKKHNQPPRLIIINQNETKICDCGSSVTRKNKTRHEKTKKHQEYLQTLQTLNLIPP